MKSERASQIQRAYMKEYRKRMTPEDKKTKNEYQRKWRLNNPDKVKEYNDSYWERKALGICSEQAFNTAVLTLHKEGLSYREVAKKLGISHMKVCRIVSSEKEPK